MLKRFENWLRSIVAEEVSKIDTDLQCEKAALRSQVKVLDAACKAQLQSFATISERLHEISQYSEEVVRLRAHTKELEAQFTGVRDTIARLHPLK
jgi:hypothetical protein